MLLCQDFGIPTDNRWNSPRYDKKAAIGLVEPPVNRVFDVNFFPPKTTPHSFFPTNGPKSDSISCSKRFWTDSVVKGILILKYLFRSSISKASSFNKMNPLNRLWTGLLLYLNVLQRFLLRFSYLFPIIASEGNNSPYLLSHPEQQRMPRTILMEGIALLLGLTVTTHFFSGKRFPIRPWISCHTFPVLQPSGFQIVWFVNSTPS